MQRKPVFLAALISICFASAAVAASGDIDKVNGSIQIESGQTAGSLETVNGSIRLADGATATKASTVNGSIELGANTRINELETVNGAIRIGAAGKVSGALSTVNGSITLAKGAEVSGHVSNVNGRIALDAAHAGAGIETVDGDMEIGADSRVEGGILVDKSNSWFRFTSRKPRVVIGPRAVVQGTLEFRREVDLFVSDSATIGPVTGATAQKFSGTQP